MQRDRSHALVALTVDLVIFTIREDRLQVLLVRRGNRPFQGRLALPGGYLRAVETLEETAVRELHEETGIDATSLHLEQLQTYSDPDRDPRGRVVTAVYLALGPSLPDPVAGTDAATASWLPVDDVLRRGGLAFDHQAILRDGLEQARSKLEYTTVATTFCTEPFTISELRRVYEVVWGEPLDPSNFRRKLTHTNGFLEPTGEVRPATTGRPAALYRSGPATLLMPPFLRPHRHSAVSATK